MYGRRKRSFKSRRKHGRRSSRTLRSYRVSRGGIRL